MSPDLKDVLIAVIPSIIPAVMVGFGILINKNDINRVGGEIAALRSHVDTRLVTIESSFNARLDGLGKQINEGVVMLVGRDTDKAERLARLEERGKS